MYCDKCHHDHQPINETVAKIFEGFIEANRKWINKIDEGEIVHLPARSEATGRRLKIGKATHFIYNLGMLEEPFNIRYVGMRDHGEGSMIEFMDHRMDKICSYYDVM
jgi:hypothetical protein